MRLYDPWHAVSAECPGAGLATPDGGVAGDPGLTRAARRSERGVTARPVAQPTALPAVAAASGRLRRSEVQV